MSDCDYLLVRADRVKCEDEVYYSSKYESNYEGIVKGHNVNGRKVHLVIIHNQDPKRISYIDNTRELVVKKSEMIWVKIK